MTHPDWAQSPYTRAALDALPTQVDTTTPPPVVDEAIRTLELERERLFGETEHLFDALHTALGEEKVYPDNRLRSRGWWPTSTSEIIAKARALPADTPNADLYAAIRQPTVGGILDQIDTRSDQHREITNSLRPLNDQYAERMWSRVFLVDNDTGHVHRHTGCSTCYPTTRFLWITELSGATDEQVVSQAGARTCLVCFPSVREEIIAGRPCTVESREGREERKAREAEAAAKKAEKIAKAVTPDGTPLTVTVDRFTSEIKTERAAELRYVEWAAEARATTWRTQEDCDDYRAGAAEVLRALAWKRGTTPEELAEELAPKVARKVKTIRGY